MRIVMLSLGYGFLMLGFLGLFLPFLQGFLFLLVGLLILARHAPWAERMLDRLKQTHPKAGELILGAEAIADRWTDKLTAWLQGLRRRVVGR